MDPDQTRPPSEGGGSKDDTLFLSSRPAIEARQFARTFLGRTLGDYEVRREIGHGSMGIVYEARHVSLERVVALKVLPPSLSVTETVIRRFHRESSSVARLDHPSIVKIYGIGEQQGVHFYAMELIDGQPLDHALRARKLSPRECAKIAAEAARALFFAHDNGIMHRDIKPANIILSAKDRPVLTDFGLARPEKAGTLTESGALVGTPIYMSPEQVRGERAFIDRRTDIYSLGVTLYEMLTGEPPFTATSTQEILRKIEFEDPRPVRRVRADIPKPLETICHKAIEKDPGRRYQTAIELAMDLERFLGGEAIQARPPAIPSRVLRKVRRHKGIAWLVALLILLTGVSAFILVSQQRDREKAEVAHQNSKRAEARRQVARFEQLMTEGHELYRDGRISTALARFEQAIAVGLDDPASFVDRGKCHFKLESYGPALSDFQRALTLDAGDLRAKIWRGITRWYAGDHEERDLGIQDIKETLEADPDDPECLLEASRLCLDLARGAETLVARDQFINAGFSRIMRTIELMERRNKVEHARLAEADQADESVLVRGLDQALVIQGLLYEEMNMPDQAAATYERATKINPGNALAWTLWRSDRETDDEPAAESPTGVPASSWMEVLMRGGLAWSRDIDWDPDFSSKAVEALSLFPPGGRAPTSGDFAERLSDDEVETVLARANRLWLEDEHDQAVQLYRDLVEQRLDLAEPYHRLTEYYIVDARDLTLARKHVEEARRIAPAHPMTLYLALRVYSLQRDEEKLREVWTVVRRFYPAVLAMPDLDLGWFEVPDEEEGDDADG